MSSNLSDINRLKRLSRFFWKLLIFRCSIEKLLLSKWFKFREDSLEVKYCKHLKLKAFQKQFHLDLDCHSIKIGDGVHVQSIFHSRLHPVFLLRSSLPSLTLFPVLVIPSFISLIFALLLLERSSSSKSLFSISIAQLGLVV